MRCHQPFGLLRNQDGPLQTELFLVSAIFTVLAIRGYLWLTDYPKIGGSGLHIAHMLWGGVGMMVAILLNCSFIGRRVQRFSAWVGGIGFGCFIDELGKFITEDNNYFFEPTVLTLTLTLTVHRCLTAIMALAHCHHDAD
eukprot:TRINITY_DN14731_c0_g2_i1.p1 TRINITY_DN14731_c0_g2~~TRINITY_DN14731_c0_g2_i1.p1  ORF type:complete len:140 (-),score=32.13 TRINITY_DN14731_c0_g2_i1:127-546(-)